MLNTCVWVPSVANGDVNLWDEQGWKEVRNKKERKEVAVMEDQYVNEGVDDDDDDVSVGLEYDDGKVFTS